MCVRVCRLWGVSVLYVSCVCLWVWFMCAYLCLLCVYGYVSEPVLCIYMCVCV